MKYDEELLELSSEACKLTPQNDNVNELVEDFQENLFKILLQKFKKELISIKDSNGNIDDLKVKLIDYWDKGYYYPDSQGYRLIHELVKSNNYASFASKYCMYFSDILLPVAGGYPYF